MEAITCLSVDEREDGTHVHVARCSREHVFRELDRPDGFASTRLELGDTSSWNRNRLLELILRRARTRLGFLMRNDWLSRGARCSEHFWQYRCVVRSSLHVVTR